MCVAADDLEGDQPAELPLHGQIDPGHASPADLLLNLESRNVEVWTSATEEDINPPPFSAASGAVASVTCTPDEPAEHEAAFHDDLAAVHAGGQTDAVGESVDAVAGLEHPLAPGDLQAAALGLFQRSGELQFPVLPLLELQRRRPAAA